LLSLKGGEVGLDGVVLLEFGFNVVVDVLEFLEWRDRAVSIRIEEKKTVWYGACNIPWSGFLLALRAAGLSCSGPYSS
jgi:hypothetical protein